MRKALAIILLSTAPAYGLCAGLEAKSDAGTFALSIAGGCELIKNRGYTPEKMRDALIKEHGMDANSATDIVNYSSAWIAKNPGKPCEQIYIDMIDKLEEK